ncbi:CAMK/CAMKL/MARK protein kinase [Spizellomyces punctatus DAOM BR117]|uniref:non-specific serine/threonine protein kinase n=1 Tax=Spizellomyces punctatus (strain DAOM BR117) TaxID=645134 RepID=A0A0L0HR77_SPIPD|nr:CAMK/CAMKL/MARK protein kinase [Spizellomyces punctatus DAOM BR117]KND03562.1 CAMK/CAMKL/MARK protein kinase [Spizellomyces punctatus DAOM BR117]|eukprot:XP_016611601.1 CAMK/CAMKL/MARK protein kinase [Spizellomyces punctatus DAOM BR117]
MINSRPLDCLAEEETLARPALGIEQDVQGKRHSHQNRIGNYDFIRTIGEGSFAKVKLAVHRLLGEKVAIKVIDKQTLPDSYSVAHLHREAQIMRMLDHPNIVQLIEVMETKRELYLVLEYAPGGEVLDYIVAHGRLKESEAKKFVRQIVEALKYCHEGNVVHRDLKAENLLLNSSMQIKISDFGLSNIFDRSKQLTTCCGSPVYSAPELIEGKRYIGPEVDAWSLGVNLYAMVVGDLPFAAKELKKLYDKVLSGRYDIPSYVSADCQDLISKLLTLDPKERYTCAQVLQHSWMVASESRSSVADEGIATQEDSGNQLGRQQQGLKAEIPHLRPRTPAELDGEILDRLEALGFDRGSAARDVLSGKFNQAAGTYYLLAIGKRRSGSARPMIEKRRTVEQTTTDRSRDAVGQSGIASRVGSTAREGDDLTSDELAKILVKAERSRRAKDLAENAAKLKREALDSDTANGAAARLQLRRRSKTLAPVTSKVAMNAAVAAVMSSEPSPIGNERRHSFTLVEEPLPASPVNRGRRHSFSPGESEIIAQVLARSRLNRGKSPPKVSTPSSRGKAATGEISPILPTGYRPVRKGSLPPIHTASDMASRFSNGSADFDHRKATASGSPTIEQPLGDLCASPSSNLRSHKPHNRTIAIDESLYLSKDLDDPDPTPSSSDQPRTIRFAFNCYTTTSLPPPVLFKRLLDTLTRTGIDCVAEGYLCACEIGQIRFEAEVCKLPRLRMYGLRFKRVCGDMWEYKRVCQKITEGLDLL